MLALGYFGSRVNRPRWISLGMLLLAMASIVFALPHFTTDLYKWGGHIEDNLCHQDRNVTRCEEDTESTDLTDYLYVFVVASFLMSVGAMPVYLLAVPYLDDCLSSHAAACYLGNAHSCVSQYLS